MIVTSTPEGDSIESFLPVFENAKSIRDYYDLRDDIKLVSEEEELELLDRMREKHPELNGKLEEARDYISNLYRQHLVRNEVQASVAEEVSEPQMEKQKSFFRRHPFLTTAAGIAALLALLYFTGPAATTAGDFGAGLIESFKGVLGKIGVGIPEVAVESTAAVAVTGEAIAPEVAEAAANAFVSPGEAMIQNAQAAQAIEAATGAADVTAGALSEAGAEVLQSPAAAEALKKAAQSGVEDPLQRIFRNLPPSK